MFRYYIIALIIILLDQISKWTVVTFMELHQSIHVIGEFFLITSHRNQGAAFGILQNQRLFFIIITIIVVIGIFYYLSLMIKQKKHLMCFSLALLLGGALGNFIDRVRIGEVVDFFHFRFQFSFFGNAVDYHFAIFNVADSAIVIAVGLILLDSLLVWREERRRDLIHDTE